MNNFYQLINGNGIVGFQWEVVEMSGNDGKTIDISKSLSNAINAKAMAKTSSKVLLIELYWVNESNDYEYVGDETDFLKIKNFVQSKLDNKNILMSEIH